MGCSRKLAPVGVPRPYGWSASTPVTPVRGRENGGRVLVEANVVRSLSPVAEWRGGALALPLARPAGERVAVLLQAENGRILGTVLPTR